MDEPVSPHDDRTEASPVTQQSQEDAKVDLPDDHDHPEEAEDDYDHKEEAEDVSRRRSSDVSSRGQKPPETSQSPEEAEDVSRRRSSDVSSRGQKPPETSQSLEETDTPVSPRDLQKDTETKAAAKQAEDARLAEKAAKAKEAEEAAQAAKKKQAEEDQTLLRALQAKGPEEATVVLNAFFGWAERRWEAFWGAFRPDSTMSWTDFEDFLKNGGGNGKQYQLGKWTGDSKRVFQLLCDEGKDFISRNDCMRERRKATARRDKCEWGLAGLRKHLTQRFGSLSAAWRTVLDPDNLGRCSKAKFLREAKTSGYHGTLKTCWAGLAGGEHMRVIRLGDLDPEVDRLLTDFAQNLVNEHGSVKDGFNEVMKHAHGQRLDLARFTELVTNEHALDRRDAKKLFHCFDPRDFGNISEIYVEENLAFLKHWDPEGLTAGSPGSKSSPGAPSSPDSLKFSPAGKEKFSFAEDGPVIGVDAPALTFDFTVVLTREEYNEYLRRRRVVRGQTEESHGIRQSARSCLFHGGGASPAKSPPASPAIATFAATSGTATPSGVSPSPGGMSPRTDFSSTAATPRQMHSPRQMVSPRQTPRSPPTSTPQQTPRSPGWSPRGGTRHQLDDGYQRPRATLSQHFQLTIPE